MRYLTTAPISWDRVVSLNRWVSHDGCGAIVTFVGVVRADRDGYRAVRVLCYEAYPEMAEPLIHRLVNEATARWPLEGVQVQHRLGLVEVGQISVVVVVAAQHRAQAYAASAFLIERIKHDVPVWKREQYDDGTSQWMTGAPALLEVAGPSGIRSGPC
jgi:molybdopterin synthase catalytic subunit